MPRLTKRELLGMAAGITALPGVAHGQAVTSTARVLQGPMVGAVSPHTITIWVRVNGDYPVEIEYDIAGDFPAPRRTAAVMARADNDHCVRIEIPDLAPATTYHYRVWVNGRADFYLSRRAPFPVRTAPDEKWRGKFSVAFGSCARYGWNSEQDIWRGVAAVKPDLFFWLGDNVYVDSVDPAVFAEEYRRQRDVALAQPLLRTVPQLATWDDHDYGLNDQDRTSPAKDAGYRAFMQYWANPSAGTPEAKGVFFSYTYGGVEFFFLDDRTWRDPNKEPDGPAKTMLGALQLAWLKDGLRRSKGVFKVLISGSGWSMAKGVGGDSWASFVTERDALFEFIRTNAITGVFLLSGDTHVAELNCIPWSEKGGYDLYDMVSSPLAQPCESVWINHRPEIRMREVYARSENFGFLQFDTRGAGTMAFTVHDPDGRNVWLPLTLTTAELKNGVSSWRDKIGQRELQRYERWKSGGSYFEER